MKVVLQSHVKPCEATRPWRLVRPTSTRGFNSKPSLQCKQHPMHKAIYRVPDQTTHAQRNRRLFEDTNNPMCNAVVRNNPRTMQSTELVTGQLRAQCRWLNCVAGKLRPDATTGGRAVLRNAVQGIVDWTTTHAQGSRPNYWSTVLWRCGAETASLIRDLTKASYRDGFISSIVWSSSCQNFAKCHTSSPLKKVKFLTKGISVGSSGTRPMAAAAASSGLELGSIPVGD